MPEKKQEDASSVKKPYVSPAQNLYAIWKVLRDHATAQKPLGAADIHACLKKMENAPSEAAIDRLLTRERALMQQLFPGAVAEVQEGAALEAYAEDGALHVVLESPAGERMPQDDVQLEASEQPYAAPSLQTVEKQLAAGVALDLDTFPWKLQCVVRRRTPEGRIRFVPYRAGEADTEERQRLYYLASALTESECAAFSEAVCTNPYLTQAQVKKFLRALDRLRAVKPRRVPERFLTRRDGQTLLSFLRLIDRAIAERKKLLVVRGEYTLQPGEDGALSPVLAPCRRNSLLEFEPYAVAVSGGVHYLIGKNRELMRLRVDRLVDVRLLETGFARPEDLDLTSLCRGPAEPLEECARAQMRCKAELLEALVEEFGALPRFSSQSADKAVFDVTVTAALPQLRRFALQYADGVEVLAPKQLRLEILSELQKAAARYGK